MHIPRKPYYVYICASHSRTLYVGMTNDLERRMREHRTKATKGFTSRYNVDRLIWWEVTGNVNAAIAREKQLKGYSRKKKVDLIEATNAGWNDLAVEMGLVVEGEEATDGGERQEGIGDAAAPKPRGDRE